MVAGLLRQNPDAVRQIVERYSSFMEKIAGAVLANPLDVEEVVQDAFIKAFAYIASYERRRASLSTWLGRIVYNKALTAWRATNTRQAVSIDDLTTEIPDTSATVPDDETELLDLALESLEPYERTMLNLVYYEGMPLGEASKILGTNPVALAARLYRLRRRLASIINNMRKR